MPQLGLLVLKAGVTGFAGLTRRLPRDGVNQLGDPGVLVISKHKLGAVQYILDFHSNRQVPPQLATTPYSIA